MTEPFEVKKYAQFVQVSCCVMTDATGVNHCQHPTPPPFKPSLRVRALYYWYRMRWNVGLWIGGPDLRAEVERYE